MKKILALILAILMIASITVASIYAEEEEEPQEEMIDFEDFYYGLGYRNAYVGAPMEASPILDGSIGEGEYSYSRVIEQDGPYAFNLESDLIEYFAHDEDYIYYAYVFKQTRDNKAGSFQFVVANDYKYPITLSGFYARIWTYFRYQTDGTIDFSQNNNTSAQQGIDPPVWDEDIWVAATKDSEMFKTCELKIAKAYFADNLEIEKSELKKIQYYLYLHNDGPGEMDGNDLWNYRKMTTEMGLMLADAGARGTVDCLYHMMILDEAPEGYYEGTYQPPSQFVPITTTTKATEATTTAPATTTTAVITTTEAATTTTAKAADATTTAAAEEKGGCGSTLAISALVMIPTLAGGVLLTSKRRKED